VELDSFFKRKRLMEVFIAKNGEQKGPFGADEIIEMIKSRNLLASDMIWHAELSEWQQASTVFDFSNQPPAGAAAKSPPPPPPAQQNHSESSYVITRETAFDSKGEKKKGAYSINDSRARIESLKAGSASGDNYTLAPRGYRLAAALLDCAIAGFSMIPGFIFGFAFAMTPGGGVGFGAAVAALGLFVLAGFQIFYLNRDGQTLGKKIMRIIIITEDTEDNPGFVKIVILRTLLIAFLQGIPVAGSVFALVDLLFIFREDRRCIHDLIAGTKVARAPERY
jgi:uncharacterized RDD family membrane protein YckC